MDPLTLPTLLTMVGSFLISMAVLVVGTVVVRLAVQDVEASDPMNSRADDA